ncbi:MAG: hypothetical protein ABIW81_02160 [Terrimesophilobacter sp.]
MFENTSTGENELSGPPLPIPAESVAGVAPPYPKSKSSLALSALIVGIVALVMAVIPFLSFVAFVPALVAVGLGIAALVNRASRGKSVSGVTLGAVALAVAIVVSSATVAGLGGYRASENLGAAAPNVSSSDVASPSDSPSAEPSDEPSSAPVPVSVPADKVYSGSGDSVVKIVLLDGADQAGVASITHKGSSNFAVWALDSNMTEQDLLVNKIGNYSGTVLFNLGSDSTTSLEITADGPWSVTLKSVLSLRTFSGGIASGTGDDVLIYRGDAGVAAITHNGSSNFAIWAYGKRSDLVVNEIGAYSGSVRWPAGPSVVAVSADGQWSITVG